MNVYLYIDRDTVLHRLDPRTKLALLLVTFVLAFAFDDPVYNVIVLAIELAVVTLARAWPNVVKMWKLLVTIAVVTTVLFALTTPGTTPLFWIVERESLLYGISVSLRLDVLIIAGLVFLSTTTNEEIAIGLVKLGLPYRFGFAISTALRLVPTIIGTAQLITQAQRSRGLDIESGNVLQRMRKAAPIVIPVFVSTVRSTQVFAMALESKGFAAHSTRTFLLDPVFRARDGLVLAVAGLTLVVAFWSRWSGFGRLEGFLG